MIKRITVLIIALLLIFSLTACSLLDTNDRFVGGELLDEEMMSEIIAEIFSDESKEEKEESDGYSNDTEICEEESSCESITAEDNESKVPSNDENIVYWTSSGKVWHTHKDCGSLKNSKEILSGSVDDALGEGKTKLCSYCENRDKK